MPVNDALVSKPSGYIPGLDGIRAVSILLVMVGHFGFGWIVPGGLGVTVFFFVSGFLITTLLLKERGKYGTISLPNFYARRFLRLSPELLLLIAFGSTVGLIYAYVSKGSIVAALTYTTNYYLLYTEAFTDASARWPHLWSLAVEEHFYLTFPLMVLLFARRTRVLASLLAGICVAALLWRIWIVVDGAPFGLGGVDHLYTYCATDARIDSIAFGCLTATLFYGWNTTARSTKASGAAILGAGFLMLVSLLYRDLMFRETFRYSLQGMSLMLFFYGLFGYGGGPVIKLLELAPMRQMGVLSYGAYLWHLEFLAMFTKVTGHGIHDADLTTKLAMIPIGFALTFLAANISYRVTAPVRRIRSRFHERPRTVPAAAE